jgi:hypothetical protein
MLSVSCSLELVKKAAMDDHQSKLKFTLFREIEHSGASAGWSNRRGESAQTGFSSGFLRGSH